MTRTITHVIIHCSATLPDPSIDVNTIRRMHVEDNGWRDVAYAFVLPQDGRVQPGRDLDGDGDVIEEVGAHTLGLNKTSIGICLVGGIDEHGRPTINFTKAQALALHGLCIDIANQFPEAQFVGHGDLPGHNKACPCFSVPFFMLTGRFLPVRGALRGSASE